MMTMPENMEYQRVTAGLYHIEGFVVERVSDKQWTVKRQGRSLIVATVKTLAEAIDAIYNIPDR